ncbi:MAG: hypothetical protein V1850_06015, partial [Candidatus Bathyarchaeota archaeon]
MVEKITDTKTICKDLEVNQKTVYNVRSEVHRVIEEMKDVYGIPRNNPGNQGSPRNNLGNKAVTGSAKEVGGDAKEVGGDAKEVQGRNEGALTADPRNTSIPDRDKENTSSAPQNSSGTRLPEKPPSHNEQSGEHNEQNGQQREHNDR